MLPTLPVKSIWTLYELAKTIASFTCQGFRHFIQTYSRRIKLAGISIIVLSLTYT